MNAADVETVVVDGRVLMAGGRLLTLNEGEVLREAAELALKNRQTLAEK